MKIIHDLLSLKAGVLNHPTIHFSYSKTDINIFKQDKTNKIGYGIIS
jgi:hypothetical protein